MKRKTKRLIKMVTRFMSVILSLILIAEVIPMQVIANEYSDETSETEKAEILTDNDREDAEPIAEDTSKRDENVKHFIMSDGTMQAAQYDVPVHFQQNGKWVDYDNTLIEIDADEEENEGKILKNKDLTVKNSDWNIRISKKTSGKKFVRIEKDGYKLSWYYKDAKKSTAELSQAEDDGDFSTLEKLSSAVCFKNVYKNTDLEYIISSDGLKENIILNSASTDREFTAEYKVNGLTPVQIDSKTVELQNSDGEAVFIFTAPFMTDANGETSDRITLSLSNIKNDTFTVKTTLDSTWLDSAERAYPVTVDPVVQTKPDTATIKNKYITSKNYNLEAYGSIYVGNPIQMGLTRGAVKFTKLPTLDKGDMVINACMYLGQLSYSDVSEPNLQINAYEITSAWSGFDSSKAGICSSDNPKYDSRVLNYTTTSAANNLRQISWDVTSAVKKWYDGKANHGIFLKPSDSRVAVAQLVSKNNNIKNGKPVMTVQYINNRGLEDYWSFTEQNLGCGTGYVNNYTGNLVVNIPICDTGSAGLSAGISYYYNGYQAGRHFAVTQGGGVYNASRSICGAGWKMNVDEQLAYLTPGKGNNDELHKQGIKYTYTDADGTVLYMKEKKDANNNVIKDTFVDELGKGYTLKIVSTGGWELTDKQNNKKTFTSGGRLSSVKSNQSTDKITYTYNSDNFLTKITDGSGNTITIGRNENNAVTWIRNLFGKILFSYSGSKLVKITYPDSSTVQFTYDSNYRLTSVISKDGTSVVYSYPTSGDTAAKNRVIKAAEYSVPDSNGTKTVGNSIKFNYNEGNYTKVTDNKNRSTVYNFDNLGRTTSAVDGLGASSAQYSKNVTENNPAKNQYLEQNNKLLSSSSSTMPIDNLLKNTSFEKNLTNWKTYNSNSNSDGGSAVDSSNAYLGKKSIKLYANADNLINRIYQAYTPVKTGTYTFSFYYKTSGLSGSGGIEAMIAMYREDGTSQYVRGNRSTYSTGGDWERLCVTAKVTSEFKTIKPVIALQNAKGTVYVDCAQFEYTWAANAYNMVENSSFKDGASSWTGDTVSTNTFTKIKGSAFSSGCPSYLTEGVIIKGNSGQKKYVRQDVQVNIPANKLALQFSGYACAKAMPKKSGRNFAISLSIHFSDDTTEYVLVDFNPSSTAWQYTSQLITPSKTNQSKHVTFLTVYFRYYLEENSACFSGMNLTLDKTGTAYSYDSKGNLTSAKDMAERNEVNTIDSANRLTGYKDEENVNYKYTYNSDNASAGTTKYQVNSAVHTYYAQRFEFKYDKHGNVIQTVKKHNTNSDIYPMQTNRTYSANGDKVLTETDSLRNKVTYGYSTTNAEDLRIHNVTQNGATVKYSYKPKTPIVTGVSSVVTGIDGTKQTISNKYNYTGERLTSITHNGFNYNFTYDGFGNRLTTKVGSQTLMTNTYGANNGWLTKSTYGNGDYFTNTYDSYGRVTGLNYNGTRRFGYVYDANGQVCRHTDLYLGNVYVYTYDMLGRLKRTDISGGSTILYNYDNVNNITGTQYKFNGSDKKTSYTYFKGGIVQNATFPNGAVKTRSLNGQAQVRPSTLTTPTGKKWSINRIYYTPNPNDTVKFTTNLMGSLIYENIDRTFGYTYDGSGNISKITDKTGTASKDSTFVYDEANQLIRENNAYTNKTVTYTYDAGGNILAKTEYPFTTGSLDGLTGTVINYTYGNTNWKDLLTAYNGQPITYDEIGNPLTYYNGTQFTWYRGRKLETATTADGTSISYSYDDSGIRTQKTVDGVATDYFLDGSAIIAEKTGNDVKWYYYDGDGTREAIEYKGNVYYYFYNAQGDVMGLYDNNLNVVVNYTYDSWGNVVSITGSMADTLGHDNPFRYRGYYYDNDTGLYYLNSRYYDANTGRFISADGLFNSTAINGYNVFTYCLNNPINFYDPSGYYTIVIPAEGTGAAKIIANPDEFVSVSRKGNTYIASSSSKKVGTVASGVNSDPEPDHPDYKPPKRGSKWVKNPNGKGEYGWLGKDGGVWVWTPNMHGGKGWTVQYPNGKHKHAYPGGGVRSHYKFQQNPAASTVKILVGGAFTVGLIADNITGVGAADDFLMIGSSGCFIAGIDGLFGEKICTECGEVYYGY